MALAGVALFVGPWVVGQPDAAKDAHVNEYVVGMVVVFVAGHRLVTGDRRPLLGDVVVLVAGAWTIASPFVLGLGDTVVGEARVYDVTLGTVLVILAAISLALLRAARKTPPDRHQAGRGEQPGGGEGEAGRDAVQVVVEGGSVSGRERRGRRRSPAPGRALPRRQGRR
jgi:hypothetical protein